MEIPAGPLAKPLLRAKGFLWLQTRPRQRSVFQQAGTVCRLDPGGVWWNLVPREHWPQDPEFKAQIDKDWDPEWGDMQQELVLIGAHMDKGGIIDSLEGCLLDDAELDGGEAEWLTMPDPFLLGQLQSLKPSWA